MNKLLTIALMFKVLDQATAPVRRINETVGQTGRELERAAGRSGQLRTGIDRIGAAAAAAAAKVEALSKKTEKLAENAQKMEGLGRPLAVGGTLGAVGIEQTLEKFGDLEEAQKRLRTTLMDEIGKVGPEFEKLNALGERLGSDLPGTTRDMLNMFQSLREQGVQTRYILGGTGEAAAKFAALMKIGYSEGAIHAAKFSESMGVMDRDMVRFMDLLQRLKYASGVEVGELAYTFKYAGGALKLLGLQGLDSARDFSAVVGMLAAAGIEGSTAGTNMAQALSRMAEIGHRLDKKQIKKLVGPILDKYDVKLSFFNEAGEFKGLRPMIEQMEKLRRLNPQEQIIVLKKLFGDEAARPLSVLLKSGVAGYDEMLRRIRMQADMETKIGEIMSGNKMQFETMSGTAENLTAHVGGLFSRLVNLPGIFGKLNDVFGKLDSWVLLHPKSAGLLAGILVTVTGLSLASGALLLAVAGLGAAWPRALEGIALLGKGASWTTTKLTAMYLTLQRRRALNRLPDAMFGDVIPGRSVSLFTRLRSASLAAAGGVRAFGVALFTTPVGWFAMALAAAGLLIYKFWGPISGFFKGMWRGLAEGAAPALRLFARLEPVFRPFKWLYNVVKSLVKPMDDVGGRAESMGLRVGRVLGRLLNFVLQLPAKMLLAGGNILDSLYEGMKRKASKPVEMIKAIAQRVRNFLPFSPAKEGPLKDIHRVRLVETVAESMRPDAMVKAMRAATAATMLAVTPVGALATTAHGAGSQVVFAPQITVQGGHAADVQSAVNQALSVAFAEFERMLERHERQKQRREF